MTVLKYEELQLSATHKLGLHCPRCQSVNYMKNGTTKTTTNQAKQRYRCKSCGKTFNTDHHTPYYRLRKRENTESYLQALYDGLSIRQAAKQAGISIKTSFQWRHKFLSSINTNRLIDTHEISGLAEIKLPYSAKGQRTTPEAHKPSRSILQTTSSGKISIIKATEQSHTASIAQLISQSTIKSQYSVQPSKLINQALRRSGKTDQTIKDKTVVAQFKNETKQAIQNLTLWTAKFRGIATKYLSQYWGWFSLHSTYNHTKDTIHFAKACCSERRISTLVALN